MEHILQADGNRKTHLSYKEVVMEYFEGKRREEHLSLDHLNYLRMVRQAWALLLDVKSKKYIVGSLIQQFDITYSYAYRILRQTQEIMGSVDQVDKSINRHIAIEMAKEAYRKAQLLDSLSEMNKAIGNFIKASGLDRDDSELPDFSKLDAHLNVMVLPEGMEDLLRQTLEQQGVINLNKLPEGAELTTYEEVDEADTEGADTPGD
jgi:hypothetical protein